MVSTESVRDISTTLEDACARNLSVEIHCESAGGLQVARSRLLALDDSAAYLDSPQNDGRDVRFGQGAVLQVYLSTDDGWRMFRSQVRRSSCEIRLNAEKTVPGMAITRPVKLEQTQRRGDFRVSVACVEPIIARMHLAPPDDPNCCPLETERFIGRLVDLSAGGLAVRVDVTERRHFRVGERFFAIYELPGGDEEIVCLVDVRHATTILDGTATRLGTRFVAWNEPHTKSIVRRMTRFGTELQRRVRRSGKS